MFKLKLNTIITTAVLSFCLIGQTQAVPLIYNEAVDGDIADTFPNPQLTLDFGVNSITGTSSGAGPFGPPDLDRFDTGLPVDAVLDSIQVSLANNPAGNGGTPGFFQFTLNGNNQQIATPDFSPINLTFGVPVSQLGNVAFNGLGNGEAYDYTIAITLSQVPLPAAFPLFLGALAGLGFVRRQQRQARL